MVTVSKSHEKELETRIERFLEDYLAEAVRKSHHKPVGDNWTYSDIERPYRIKVESVERRKETIYEVAFRDVKYDETRKSKLSRCILSIEMEEITLVKWLELNVVGPVFH